MFTGQNITNIVGTVKTLQGFCVLLMKKDGKRAAITSWVKCTEVIINFFLFIHGLVKYQRGHMWENGCGLLFLHTCHGSYASYCGIAVK